MLRSKTNDKAKPSNTNNKGRVKGAPSKNTLPLPAKSLPHSSTTVPPTHIGNPTSNPQATEHAVTQPISPPKSFRIVWGTQWWCTPEVLLKAISPMLSKEDSKSVVVKKSYRRLNGKSKWWFTIIAPPSTLSIIEAAWPTLQAELRWTLQSSLRKHYPLPPTCPLLPMPPPQIPHHFPQLHSHSRTLIITLPNFMHHHHLPALTAHLLLLVLRIIHSHPHHLTQHCGSLWPFFRGNTYTPGRAPIGACPPGVAPLHPPCAPVTELLLTSSTGTGSQHLRVGCFNIRGLKANTYYTHQLLNQHDIFTISEHWLHTYELQSLQTLHPDFNFLSSVPPSEEDDLYCRPRYLRGHGGVAIAWRKSLDQHISKLDNSSSHRVVGISLQAQLRPICLLSVYLPTRTGCTDIFKESLDYLDSMINLLGYENDVFILGDMNADLGLSGGPMASTPINEQGKILMQYLKRWNFLSAHLHLSPTLATSNLWEWSPWLHINNWPHSLPFPCTPHLSYPAVSSRRNHLTTLTTFLITCQISTHLPNSPIHRKKIQSPTPPQLEEAHNSRSAEILYIPTRS